MKTSIKKILGVSLAAITLLPCSTFAAGKLPPEASKLDVKLEINGTMETIPENMGSIYLDKNKSLNMAPLRFITEKLGADVKYVEKQKGFDKGGTILKTKDNWIVLKTGSNKAEFYTNSTISLDKIINSKPDSSEEISSRVFDGRYYVPIRFVAEKLGYEIKWDNGTVKIGKGLMETTPNTEYSTDNSQSTDVNGFSKESNANEVSKQNSNLLTPGTAIETSTFDSEYARYRESNGLQPLRMSEELNSIAKIRVEEEFEKLDRGEEVSHYSPSGARRRYGENLYAGYGYQTFNSTDTLEAWKSSPGHNRNLLKSEYNEYGLYQEVRYKNGNSYFVAIQILRK